MHLVGDLERVPARGDEALAVEGETQPAGAGDAAVQLPLEIRKNAEGPLAVEQDARRPVLAEKLRAGVPGHIRDLGQEGAGTLIAQGEMRLGGRMDGLYLLALIIWRQNSRVQELASRVF